MRMTIDSAASPPKTLAPVFGATPVPLDLVDDLVDGVAPRTLSEVDALERGGLSTSMNTRILRLLDGDGDFLWDDLELIAAHRDAYGHVWRWAGQYRSREMSIGVDPSQISTKMRMLFGDASAWREFATYSPVEQAVRFHCEVGRIHPFVNGNGRLARVYCQLMLSAAQPATELTWSETSMTKISERRKEYIRAIREADSTGDYSSIVVFATSP